MNILIAEAAEDARNQLAAMLKEWGYIVTATGTGDDALKALQVEDSPKLVALGSLKQGMCRREVCREIRERADSPYIYTILLVSEENQEVVGEVKAGADDLVVAPLENRFELRLRLRAGKRIIELGEELRRAQATIGYQAYHDPLTGLWNRGAIIDALRRELARVRREGIPVGLILAYVDDLKGINQTYGYMVGDAVIRAMARDLRSFLRPYDAVGRYAGDAFLMIATGCDLENSKKKAEDLLASLRSKSVDASRWGKFTEAKEGAISISYSFGVVSAKGETTSEALLRAVDQAVAAARSDGGGKVVVGSLR